MSRSRRFVVADVHGCALTLHRLVTRLHLARSDRLHLLGDLIDRGPGSKGVIDLILYLQNDGFRVSSIRGNHEQMLLDACTYPGLLPLWRVNGGDSTLRSFGIPDPRHLPNKYLDFFTNLQLYHLLDDFVLVHAGVNCSATDPFADTETLLWSRNPAIDVSRLGGRKVICGHTPVSLDHIRATTAMDRIMIDNGCVYRGVKGMGNLVALELESLEIIVQANVDDT